MRFTRAGLAAVGVAAAFALTACSEGESGTPETMAGSASSEAQSPTAPEESSAVASSLSSFDPCTALRNEEVAKHGPIKQNAPEQKTVGGASACTWTGDMGGTAQLVPTTSVVIRENGGVQDMNDLGSGVDHTTEGGRDYARVPGPNGCAIAIGVGDKSRVDIQVTSVDNEAEACEIANALVEVAEPRVPKR